ncbi:MAG: cyclic nucleotide-binding domain-containing protein [Candidatus Latescibacterota bacterium]
MEEKGSPQKAGQSQQLVQFVLQTPPFAHFAVRQVQPLLKVARPRPLRAGEALWRAGDQPQGMLILVQGAARVKQGGGSARRVEPVAVLGEVELVAGVPYATEVTALSDSLFLELSAALVEALLARDSAFCQRLSRNIAGALAAELQQANERLGALTRRREDLSRELDRARLELNDLNLVRRLREERGA